MRLYVVVFLLFYGAAVLVFWWGDSSIFCFGFGPSKFCIFGPVCNFVSFLFLGGLIYLSISNKKVKSTNLILTPNDYKF
jgi:hypothetical protein